MILRRDLRCGGLQGLGGLAGPSEQNRPNRRPCGHRPNFNASFFLPPLLRKILAFFSRRAESPSTRQLFRGEGSGLPCCAAGCAARAWQTGLDFDSGRTSVVVLSSPRRGFASRSSFQRQHQWSRIYRAGRGAMVAEGGQLRSIGKS